MPRHCASCNRSGSDTKFYGDFCENCAKLRLLKKAPDSVNIRVCKKCGRVYTGKGYENESGISMNAAVAFDLKKHRTNLLAYEGDKALVEFSEETKDGVLAAEKELSIRREKQFCERCSMLVREYYEATIQLRGNPDRITRTKERIERYISKSGAMITKEKEVENGIDLYVSQKAVVSSLILRMRLTAVSSYTLYGLKRGKRVYRNTYAIHL
jgi:NMD protein affecting ribosome stability and mRNA decay